MMAKQDFIDQLEALGYSVEDRGKNCIAFSYAIPVGRFVGQQIMLGLVVGDDFPVHAPSGPHMNQHLLPFNNESKEHPNGGIHKSEQFGDGWQYWSRPHPDWNKTDKTVKSYMAYIRRLFDQ